MTNRNGSRLQPDVRTLAISIIALALSCARVDPPASSSAPLRAGAAVIGPPTVANTVHQWFWKGLGATVSTITAALFVRGVVLRRMRRTLLAPGQVSR